MWSLVAAANLQIKAANREIRFFNGKHRNRRALNVSMKRRRKSLRVSPKSKLTFSSTRTSAAYICANPDSDATRASNDVPTRGFPGSFKRGICMRNGTRIAACAIERQKNLGGIANTTKGNFKYKTSRRLPWNTRTYKLTGVKLIKACDRNCRRRTKAD